MIKPFEKNTVKTLWNDPYLSQQMLTHHLDFTTNISSRKYYTITKTVMFLLKETQLQFGSSVLDLGCGPGLYTNLFQSHGYDVTGVDFSTSSIEYARSQNPEVNYIEADYIDVELPKQYDLITQIFCDFSVLSPPDASKLLTKIHNHLAPNGYFFFDVHNLQFFQNSEEMIYTHVQKDGLYMEGKATITETIEKYPDLLVQLTHIVAKGKREVELYNWIKCYTEEEITKLLKQHGFKVINTYDTTDGETEKDTQYFALLCQKSTE